MQNNPTYERYQRQIILKDFGEAGQQKLLQSKVLVVGAGGLGCPALQYLAAAGTGTIGIVDDDVVSITNLHRQVLYSIGDVGYPKAEKAQQGLCRLNPDIHIEVYKERLTALNALDIIGAYDIVLDGTDNFATRYLVNDACVLLDKPLVYGAIAQFEGQVGIFNFRKDAGAVASNYRDLFPNPPGDGEILNCAEAGVLGVLPGIIGTMQANEAIKLITGIGQPLINRMLTYNALSNQVYEVMVTPRKETMSLIPQTTEAFRQTDYEWLCSSAHSQFEIDAATFDEMRDRACVDVIDVRAVGELPFLTGPGHVQIPLSELKQKMDMIKNDTVIVFCQSGKRSMQAARMLHDNFGGSKKIYSLQGGINKWAKNNPVQQ